jgi:hypothetical protein
VPQASDVSVNAVPPAAKGPAAIDPSPRTTRLVAAAFLALLATLLIASVHQESQTFDEAVHITAGFEYWKHGDFGRNPEHPPFAKLLATIPILSMGLKEPPNIPVPYFKALDMINGSQLLYSADADAILLRSRMVIALFTLVLALLVFFAAQEMFNRLTAILALGLFALEPTILAHGALVTTDMPVSCLFFASVLAFYLYVRKPSLVCFALCAVTTALTIVTKHSGILILPTLFLLAFAELAIVDRSPTEQSASTPPTLWARAKPLATLLATVLLLGYAVLWAIYGFRYAARPGQLQIIPSLEQYAAGLAHPLQHSAILFLAHHHLMPEAYLYGWIDILLIAGYRPTFILGHIYPLGQWFFYPAIILIKATLALLVLLLLLPFCRILGKRREFIFLTLPVLLYLGTAIASMINLGIRHLLPIFPFCIVLAGTAAASLLARSKAIRIAVAALLLLTTISSLHAFPDYLAYSNEAAGGPSHTYRLATDSNSDWGQELKWVKSWLDRNPTSNCWFAYTQPFVSPAYYGIPCHPLVTGLDTIMGVPMPPMPTTVTGTLLIGGTDLSGLFWGPGTLNPYQVFAGRKPDAAIGNVVLVYHGTFNLPLLAAQTNTTNALSMLRQGRFPEALALAQTAVQQAPDSAEVNAILGQALLATGHEAEGRQANATALHLAQTVYPEYQKELVDEIEHPRNGP